MKDDFVQNIGTWGQRHYGYLKKHSPTVINVMRMKGTLEQYLKDIDNEAQDSSCLENFLNKVSMIPFCVSISLNSQIVFASLTKNTTKTVRF